MKLIVNIFVPLAFIFLVVAWACTSDELPKIYARLAIVTSWQWLLLIALKVIIAILSAIKFSTSLTLIGKRLTCFEWIGLPAFNTLAGYVSPFKLGLVGTAAYLVRYHGTTLSQFLGTKMAVAGTDLASSLFILALILGATASPGLDNSMIRGPVIIATLVLAACGGLIFLARALSREYRIPPSVTSVANDLSQALRKFSERPWTAWSLLGQNSILLAAKAAALFLCATFLGIDSSIYYCAIIMVFVSLSANISVSPGNIGLTEGLIAGAFVLVGASSDAAIATSLLSRISSLMVQVPIGLFFTALYLYSRTHLESSHRRRADS